MKKENNKSIKDVLKKLYKILNKKQKIIFGIIIIIMLVSAFLTQITPKAIGWLTDDILTQNEIAFEKVIPFWIVNTFLYNFYKDTFLYSIGVK